MNSIQNRSVFRKSDATKMIKYNINETDWKKVRTPIRVVAVILCFIGFLYQTSELFSIYFSGKTSVDNRVERLKHSSLPAITICLPTFISMNNFADFVLKNSSNQTLHNIYQEYLAFREQSLIKWNEQVMTQQEKFHRMFVFDIFPNINIFIIEVFNYLSIDNLNLTMFKSRAINENDELIELSIPTMVQSLVPFSDPRICFTYFSGFDPKYRDNKIDLIQMEMTWLHDNSTFPLNQYNQGDFHIALHSPNTHPIYIRAESFESLTMGRVNAISYTEIKTRLLPAPYETDCRIYSLDDLGQNNMRSDCIQKCVDQNMLNTEPKIDCISVLFNFKLIRKDNLFNLSMVKLCDLNYSKSIHLSDTLIHKQIHLENNCKQECHKNCEESYYEFKIEMIKAHSWIKTSNEFAITLKHNRFPDQIITHKPVMLWIELVSNFGGLLGMWLGLSIAFLLEYIIKFI